MSIWAIGDIQGCMGALERLLMQMEYRKGHDQLWLAGDLVNRGPANAEVLRWAKAQGESVVAVLGNHDLHAIALHRGVGISRKRDRIDDLLNAPDADELVDWLLARPLYYESRNESRNESGGWLMVHAGLHPHWSLDRLRILAAEVTPLLKGPRAPELLHDLERWKTAGDASDEDPWTRALEALRILVSVRVLDSKGQMPKGFSGSPADAPPGTFPWFCHPAGRHWDARILCGHWSRLGLYRAFGVDLLDSSCVWGGKLTALCLDDGRILQADCGEMRSDG